MVKSLGRTAIVAILGATIFTLTAPAWAVPVACDLPTGEYDFDFAAGQYDNSVPPTSGCFRDVVRGGGIEAGTDFGGTGHTSLNISGSGGPAGRTWVTVVDQDPDTPDADNVYKSSTVCADVLIQRFNNRKGAGVVQLYNEDESSRPGLTCISSPGGCNGLAMIITSAGNTDLLTLGTIAGDANGIFTPITSVALGSQVGENRWYRVVMGVDVSGSSR
jgi:hypothetical protein